MRTVAACILASGCIASSGSALSPTGCVAKPPVRVQLFGDSTQAGYDARGLVAHPPPIQLQAFFDAKYGRGAVVVTSRAVLGSTARQLADGADGLNLRWPRSVDADVVVINHGINDRLLPVKGYRAALERLALAPARVIFETPNPVKGSDIEPIVTTMREVAAKHGLPVADAFEYVSGLDDWKAMLTDYVHPSDELYRRISEKVLQPAVDNVVAKMRCAAE